MWKRKDADEVIFLLLNLQKKISWDKHFCFRFGTILIIFLFIDVNLADSKKKHLSKKKKRDKKAIIRFDDHRWSRKSLKI